MIIWGSRLGFEYIYELSFRFCDAIALSIQNVLHVDVIFGDLYSTKFGSAEGANVDPHAVCGSESTQSEAGVFINSVSNKGRVEPHGSSRWRWCQSILMRWNSWELTLVQDLLCRSAYVLILLILKVRLAYPDQHPNIQPQPLQLNHSKLMSWWGQPQLRLKERRSV